MLDFIKWLLTPLWLKRYLQEEETHTEDPVETTSLVDSDDNVIITKNVDTTPVIDENTEDNEVDTTPIDELWNECDDIVNNMMWDATDEALHMNLDEFIVELNKNAELSLKQKDQMKNYVIDDLFTTSVIDENTEETAPPKKKKKGKKKRKLRYNLRNKEK